MTALREEIRRLAPMLSDARLDDIMDAIACSFECCYDEHSQREACILPTPRPRPGPATQCPYVRSFNGEERGYLYCLAGVGHDGEHKYDARGIKGGTHALLGEWEPIEEARRKTAAAGGRWPT